MLTIGAADSVCVLLDSNTASCRRHGLVHLREPQSMPCSDRPEETLHSVTCVIDDLNLLKAIVSSLLLGMLCY